MTPMRTRSISPLILRSARPSLAIGVAVAFAGTALETLAIYPLAHVAPVVSLGVVYLIGVVVVSTYWGSASASPPRCSVRWPTTTSTSRRSGA